MDISTKKIMDYFRDKVVVITGSSRGIGKETALTLGKLGAKVVLNGRTEEALERTTKEFKTKGINCISHLGDVSKKEDSEALIDKAIEAYGKLNILINNAGIVVRGKFGEMTAKTWQEVININTLGCIYPSIYALSHLLKTKGHLIFISSLGGKVGLPGHSAYSVSKMGLTSLVKALNMEYNKKDLHTGIIYVGFTENESDKKIMNANGEYTNLKTREGIKLSTRHKVARAIVKMIVNRKLSVTLTFIGKLQGISLRFFPFVVRMVLSKSFKNYEKMYE